MIHVRNKVNYFVQQKNTVWKRPSSPTSHSFHLARFPKAERKNVAPPPEVVSMDVLALFTDEELYARQKMIGTERSKLLHGQQGYVTEDDVRAWDDELAYVARELQIRHVRRNAHAEYVRQCEIDFTSAEANAPTADLDNTGFLRSIGMLN